MKNPNILIALIIIFFLILGVKYSYYDEKEQEKHPSINEIAIRPDDLLRNAVHYYRDYGQRLTAIDNIERAIKAMSIIEKDMDSTSNYIIENTITDLESLIVEFEEKHVDEIHMEHAFANAMNSLAFAQLRISERYLEQGLKEEASIATKYALKHLLSAVYFSEGAELEAELHIMEMIKELDLEENLNDPEVRKKIHSAVVELDVILANAHVIPEKIPEEQL